MMCGTLTCRDCRRRGGTDHASAHYRGPCLWLQPASCRPPAPGSSGFGYLEPARPSPPAPNQATPGAYEKLRGRAFFALDPDAAASLKAFPWDTAPKYLIRDNDRAFGAVFKARVRAMGIRDRPTSFRSPWQNGLVERLIGSARHECTDHVIVLNEDHLRRILFEYASYYNEVRTHLSLGKDAPCTRPIERFGDIIAQPILGGLTPSIRTNLRFSGSHRDFRRQ